MRWRVVGRQKALSGDESVLAVGDHSESGTCAESASVRVLFASPSVEPIGLVRRASDAGTSVSIDAVSSRKQARFSCEY